MIFFQYNSIFYLEPRNENVENEDATVDPIATSVIDPKLGAKKRAKLEAKAEKKVKREVRHLKLYLYELENFYP